MTLTSRGSRLSSEILDEESRQSFVTHKHHKRRRSRNDIEDGGHWVIRSPSKGTRCERCNRVNTLVAKNNSPRIFARSFIDQNSQMAMSLGGFRVVESSWVQKHLEFEVIVSTGTETYRAWKSHTEFQDLLRKLVRKLGEDSMARCSKRWDILQQSVRWWTARDVKYMVYRFCLLTDFVQELFFAVDDLTCLVDWMTMSCCEKCSGCTRTPV